MNVTVHRNADCHCGHRKGFTIVEMLVTITMLTGIMSLVGMTFSLLMRSQNLAMQSLVTERTIARLALQFRDDVRESLEADVTNSSTAAGLQLTLKDVGGVRVRYRVTKKGVVRLILGDQATFARDDYRLPDCRVRFSAGAESDPFLRTLVIERPMATITRHSRAAAPLRPLEIQAHLHQRPPTVRQTPTEAVANDSVNQSMPTEESK